ncbi:unnamed protein product [Cylindrotheca closterium]|uniref:Uncharacterized protein n=1 Tax=Cylindrotheca closterium TaxID=2856 RepID=A0AAD2CRX5_9STRA|nr:unnamed protein product [Cylindrotheca closterium]
MEEAILQRHPGRTAATQHRNKRGKPIDGIFTTSGVTVQAGGYYNFDEFFSCDHRGLWIDINLEKSLGGYKPQKTPYKPRKLTMLDTTAVRRYLQLVHKGYEEYSIPSRLASLHHQLQLNEGTMTATMDNYQVTDVSIVTSAGYTDTQRGPAILIMNQFASIGKGQFILSSPQMEHFGIEVDDRSSKVGGKQRLSAPDGWVIPMEIVNGLP